MAAESPLHSLLADVRAHLRRRALERATRQAGWAICLVVLTVSAVHLLFAPIPPMIALALPALTASLLIVPALVRRPSDAACALFVDRELGGQSAYSTLLEARAGNRTSNESQAHLEQWVNSQCKESAQRLARLPQQPPLRAIATAVAVSITSLALFAVLPPDSPRILASTTPAAESPSGNRAPAPRTLDSALDPLTSATRSPAGNAGQRAPSPRTASATGIEDKASAQTDAAASARSRSRPSGGATPSSNEGAAGNAPGSAVDRRYDGATMRPSEMPVPRRAIDARPGSADTQSLMSRATTYDDRSAALAQPDAMLKAAPAAPPTDRSSATLSPAAQDYVKAWGSVTQ